MKDKCCETCYNYVQDCRCSEYDGIECNHHETWRSWEPKDTNKSCSNCQYSNGHTDGIPHGCFNRRVFMTNSNGESDCRDNNYFAWDLRVEDDIILDEPVLIIDDGNPFNTQTGGDHYKKIANCPDVAEWCTMQKIEFSEGNVIKYVFRHERKNGFEDIEKAYQYLRFIAWVKYGKTL